jgi:hypothetical protein
MVSAEMVCFEKVTVTIDIIIVRTPEIHLYYLNQNNLRC